MNIKRIVVTAEDIAKGKRQSYCRCPIARAVRRAFRAPSDRKVVVRYEAVVVGDLTGDTCWIADVPSEADRFMKDFDGGLPVEPITFQMYFR